MFSGHCRVLKHWASTLHGLKSASAESPSQSTHIIPGFSPPSLLNLLTPVPSRRTLERVCITQTSSLLAGLSSDPAVATWLNSAHQSHFDQSTASFDGSFVEKEEDLLFAACRNFSQAERASLHPPSRQYPWSVSSADSSQGRVRENVKQSIGGIPICRLRPTASKGSKITGSAESVVPSPSQVPIT